MGIRHRRRGWALPVGVATLLSLAPASAQTTEPVMVVDQEAGTVTYVTADSVSVPIVADLTNPRGLALSPDGSLLVVVEAGDASGEGTLVGVTPDRTARPLAGGLDFPEGVAFLDDDTLLYTTFGDQGVWELDLRDGEARRLAQLASAPTGMVVFSTGEGTPPQQLLAVATWNGFGLLFDLESGGFAPFTDALAGGGHPDFAPESGVCIPEYEANRVSCWPLDGAPPTLVEGFDGPVGVVLLPNGLLAVSDATGVHVVHPVDGTLLYTLPFENPAAMVIPGERGARWLPPAAPPSTTTTASGTSAPGSATTATSPGSAAPPPEEPSPTSSTMVTPEPGTIPPAAAAPGAPGPVSWWWWPVAALLLLLGLLAGALRVRARRRSRPEGRRPAPGEGLPGASVGPDPCRDVCAAAARAEEAAERAAAAAEVTAREADDAARAAQDAAHAATEAEERTRRAARAAEDAAAARREAEKPPRHRGGYAASGDREYTGADHERVQQESARIDAAVAAGEMTLQEAQAEKAKLRDPETWRALREREEREHARRRDQARQRAERADHDREQARQEAAAARERAGAAATRAAALRRRADAARRDAETARREAATRKKACAECRSRVAVAAAGGPDSWITRRSGIGGPCGETDGPKTIERTETFLVADPTRRVVVEETSLRPERIAATTRRRLRAGFRAVGRLLGLGAKVPLVPGLAKAPLAYLAFVTQGAAEIMDGLEKALRKSRRAGGLGDYFFVKVTLPRSKVTVTCTCTIACRDGVWTRTGCRVTETSAASDLVEESEGTRREIERFLAGMQARARQAEAARAARESFVATCRGG